MSPMRDGPDKDGGSCRGWLRLRDASQTDTDTDGHSGPPVGPPEGPLQETEIHVQVVRLRVRGRPRTLSESTPGSDRGASTAATAVHLVPAVRRHRLQDPEREGGAFPSMQKLGAAATSGSFSTITHQCPIIMWETKIKKTILKTSGCS